MTRQHRLIHTSRRSRICPTCNGTGKQSGLPPQETHKGCSQCGGTGQIPD
jgi:DnaJ-class molecular chaperone